jgi:hypothetical protein
MGHAIKHGTISCIDFLRVARKRFKKKDIFLSRMSHEIING